MASINNSILSEVYNFYQTSLTPRPSSRFDAHKRSELKNVYNSIINQSKEDSVFLFGKTSDVMQYTIAMKESAMSFQHDMASLGGLDGDNLFKQKSVYSSNPEIAKAEYLNESASNTENADSYELTVNELARPQTNKGFFLNPDTLNINPGSYSFDVNTSSSSYELQFSINEEDTNHDVQRRLARLINNSGIGLNAAITSDMEGNTSLSISSTSNGSSENDNILFEITDDDTSQLTGVVDYLGIRNPSQEASWAHYTVNGETFSSPDNQVSIDNTYSVKLSSAAPGTSVTIGTKPDYESLKDSITGIAGSYNNFIRTASEYLEKQPRTTVLIDSMKRMTSYYGNTFRDLGLSQQEDGTIAVNESKLSDSLTNTADENTIDSMKKFARSALRKISQVQLNPMDYVDKRIVAYKNPNKSHYPNPYITSAYSGMIFNGYM